ncbi:MAG: hypothetical protein HEQ40_12110 [Lacibacter sp.]|jgi:hypothetical protein
MSKILTAADYDDILNNVFNKSVNDIHLKVEELANELFAYYKGYYKTNEHFVTNILEAKQYYSGSAFLRYAKSGTLERAFANFLNQAYLFSNKNKPPMHDEDREKLIWNGTPDQLCSILGNLSTLNEKPLIGNHDENLADFIVQNVAGYETIQPETILNMLIKNKIESGSSETNLNIVESSTKLIWNGQKNQLYSILRQLKELTYKDNPLLSNSYNSLAEFVKQNVSGFEKTKKGSIEKEITKPKPLPKNKRIEISRLIEI